MPPPRRLVLLDAPSNLGLMPPMPDREPGVRQLAEALRARDLLARLGAEDGGRVEPPPYQPKPDQNTRIRNAESIATYSRALANVVKPLLVSRRFPLILGGDCSILLGPMLALRELGRYGLMFVDGHRDFLAPRASSTGGAAGMELALATGRGPELFTNPGGLRPLVRDEDVAALGYRDVGMAGHDLSPEFFTTGIKRCPLDQVREMGPARAARAATAELDGGGVTGFWIHLDVDVLDDEQMPAVDSRQPGVMTFSELRELLLELLTSELAVGMQLTQFDPELDPGGCAAELTALLVEVLKR